MSEGDSDVDEDGNKKPFQAAVLKKTKEPIVMNIRVRVLHNNNNAECESNN